MMDQPSILNQIIHCTLILWSDQETTMLGHINAMGLQGGSVEISSKDTLRYLGLQNIKMVEGGHLLLDPKILPSVILLDHKVGLYKV